MTYYEQKEQEEMERRESEKFLKELERDRERRNAQKELYSRVKSRNQRDYGNNNGYYYF